METQRNLYSIPKGAYKYHKDIEEVQIHEDVIAIGDEVFEGCTNMTSAILHDDITSLGKDAFYGCVNLEYVKLSKNLKIINTRTFAKCVNLQGVVIPESVVRIADDAFRGCSKQLTIYGRDGSYAQDYARKNNINFVLLYEVDA